MKNYHDIAIAYAAVCQSANLVQQLALSGVVKERSDFETMIKSLLVTNPDSLLEIYDNDLTNLKTGFSTALAQLGGGSGRLDTDIGRYWINILSLSQKLNKNNQAKAEMVKRLEQIERQLPLYENDVMVEQIIANFASIYSDIISPLGSRIHVLGSADYLARPDIQQKIRACLLAGIRAGILWQQVGGTRWQFLFFRRKIFKQINGIYKNLTI